MLLTSTAAMTVAVQTAATSAPIPRRLGVVARVFGSIAAVPVLMASIGCASIPVFAPASAIRADDRSRHNGGVTVDGTPVRSDGTSQERVARPICFQRQDDGGRPNAVGQARSASQLYGRDRELGDLLASLDETSAGR